MTHAFQTDAFQPDAFQVVADVVVTPSTLALTLATFTPTIFVSSWVVVTPLTLALALTTYAPIILVEKLASALKYILELRDGNGDLVSILQNAYGISFSEMTNEAPLQSFSIPADDDKAVGLTRANELWLRNYKTGAVMRKFRLNARRDIRR